MATHEGSNGFDGEQLQKYLAEIDKADDKLLKLKMEHMSECKGPRGRIKGVLKEAKQDGLNMEALRAVIAKHRAERKIDQKLAELEADDRADYDAMREALGDFGGTELGEAALARARPKGEQLDTLARADEGQLGQVGRG